MGQELFRIATRQKADLLVSNSTPILSGQTFQSAVVAVDGYAQVSVFVVSDQAFTVRVREACAADGTFVVTQEFTSAAETGGTRQLVRQRALTCGLFARIDIENTAGVDQTELQACVVGIPEGGSGAGGGGDAGTPADMLWSFPGTVSTDQNGNIPRLRAARAESFVAFDVNAVQAPVGAPLEVTFRVGGAPAAVVTIPAGDRFAETVVSATVAKDVEIWPEITSAGGTPPGSTLLMRARRS